MSKYNALWDWIKVNGTDNIKLTYGHAHDGLMDARNTAKLVEKMELDPNCDISVEYKNAKSDIVAEPLSFSMGSLFAGINLADLPA